MASGARIRLDQHRSGVDVRHREVLHPEPGPAFWSSDLVASSCFAIQSALVNFAFLGQRRSGQLVCMACLAVFRTAPYERFRSRYPAHLSPKLDSDQYTAAATKMVLSPAVM